MIRRNDTQYSKFWMGDDEFEFDPKRDYDAWDTDTLLRLASFKRAVANFVRIVTGKNIPVLYNTGEQSYTNGTSVVLSAKLEHNQFDTAVGTALHEATHCVLTDFNIHRYMEIYQSILVEVNIENLPKDQLEVRLYRAYSNSDDRVYIKKLLDEVDYDLVSSVFMRLHKLRGSEKSWETQPVLWSMSKLMENWCEDRRIDYFQFSTSPGYKGYYNAMYSSFFWSKLTGKAIRAKNYARTETWDSYKFRIINLLHPDTDLDALKGLREIWSIVDIHNISRLKSVLDSWNLGFRILDVVLKYMELEKNEEEEKKSEPAKDGEKGKSTTKKQSYDDDVDENDGDEPSDDDKSPDGGADKDNDTGDDNYDTAPPPGPDSKDKDGDGEEGDDDDESDEKSDDASDDSDDENLSPAQQKKMEKEEEKQKAFLDGVNPKKKMSKQAAASIKSLEASGVSLDSVGKGLMDGNGTPFKVQCVVIRKVTKELIDGGVFNHMFYATNAWNDGAFDEHQHAIEEGFRLGTILGKKLQIRNEARTTKYNRLETGRIDKKLLASLGYNNERVFFRTTIDKFNPMMLHISVDASGSMAGKKWKDTMTLLVSMIKAASMTANLNVVVSMRGTCDGTTTSGRISRRRRYTTITQSQKTAGYAISVRPLVAIVYDSRVDKLSKVMTLFKYIRPGGSTPDGLAFEPIIDEMVAGKDGEMESVFVNISDGQPCFSASISNGDGSSSHFDYSGRVGAKHTASMVQRMRGQNIKILAYIIQERSWDSDNDLEIFKMCYGKDSRKIDTKNIVQLAKTLNEKFLEKN